MTLTSDERVLVVGLPGTGKTTFLAALWDAVSGAGAGALTLSSLDGDTQYLNELRNEWADCREVPRTGSSSENHLTMLLQDKSTSVCEVSFCDMSGESFANQWAKRYCTKSYLELAREATAVLLFIHPETVEEGILISEAQPLIEAATSKSVRSRSKSAEIQATAAMPEERQKATAEDKTQAATQVKMVELVQFVMILNDSDSLRLCVIVSAWDLVQKTSKGKVPRRWLSERMPLLAQYLDSNRERLSSEVFGVSAQGGDLAEDADKLLDVLSTPERVIVQHEEAISSDITAPLYWLLRGVHFEG